ncbi:MAG: DNA repair protein RecO [Verrucomicrobiota bacterium]
MEERATGLILRTRLLTETSLIVHWLTPDQGRLATVAKGARRPKSPLRGKLDLFYLANFTFARSLKSDLHNLREVELVETHEPLRHDLTKIQQMAYAAGLIEQNTETDTPLPELYELLRSFCACVSKQRTHLRYPLAFELKLLAELGLLPDFSALRHADTVKTALAQLLESDWATLALLELSPAILDEINHFQHGHLIYHLGRLPASRSAAMHGEVGV